MRNNPAHTRDTIPLPSTAAEEKASPPAAFSSQPDTEPVVDDTMALAKVRDLLFGDQARDIDKRLQEMEKRLWDALDRIHQQTSVRIDELGRALQTRLDALATRVDDLEDSFHREQELTGSRIDTLRVEIIDRFEAEVAALGVRMTESQKETTAHIEQVSGVLDAAKTNRDTLATLFLEMADRVRER